LSRVFVALAVVLAAGAASCGDDGDEASDPPPATFLAFASTFSSFRGWTSFHSDGPAPGTQPVDVLGPRTQYINRLPPAGATSYPVGTVIVEARESGKRPIFAMVKRGGGYNAGGAIDWEWFELTETPASGAVTIAWRGLGPPTATDSYGGDPLGGCNPCHAAFRETDYVGSAQLKLAR
jgi:hypothetical protein